MPLLVRHRVRHRPLTPLRRTLLGLLSALGVVVTLLVAAPAGQAAPAAGSCTPGTTSGGTAVHYCTIWIPSGGAPVYSSTETGSGVVDRLLTGGNANWFYCQVDGGTASTGDYTSDNWAKTVGDNSNRIGWVPAIYFAGAEDHWAGLPACTDSPPPPSPTGTASGSACGHSYTSIPARSLALIKSACAQTSYTYAWGGGHATNPGASRGTCDIENGAPNDCNVIGFDCSGLVRYAYWQATRSDGLAGATGTQWGQAHALPHRGEVNPGADKEASSYAGQLQPGDIMWFGDSGPTSHHIAIYLGGNEVINAAQSGQPIKRSPLSGFHDFIGAVRIW